MKVIRTKPICDLPPLPTISLWIYEGVGILLLLFSIYGWYEWYRKGKRRQETHWISVRRRSRRLTARGAVSKFIRLLVPFGLFFQMTLNLLADWILFKPINNSCSCPETQNEAQCTLILWLLSLWATIGNIVFISISLLMVSFWKYLFDVSRRKITTASQFLLEWLIATAVYTCIQTILLLVLLAFSEEANIIQNISFAVSLVTVLLCAILFLTFGLFLFFKIRRCGAVGGRFSLKLFTTSILTCIIWFIWACIQTWAVDVPSTAINLAGSMVWTYIPAFCLILFTLPSGSFLASFTFCQNQKKANVSPHLLPPPPHHHSPMTSRFNNTYSDHSSSPSVIQEVDSETSDLDEEDDQNADSFFDSEDHLHLP